MQDFINRYYPTLLLFILAFSFFTRVYRLNVPEGYMFDEVYHAVTAKLIANNDPRAFEWWNPPPEEDTAVDWLHPPVAKYTQAAMITLLGEHPFGWRFSSALFGIGVIWLTSQLAQVLFENKSLSLLSALLASLDGLILTMSRIAMNDIHVTFFILLTFLLYYKHLKENFKKEKYHYTRYLLYAGIAGGMAASTKWSGAFALLTIGLMEGINWLSTSINIRKLNKTGIGEIKNFIRIFATLLLIPALIYLSSYIVMFMQGKDFSHFYELHSQTWHYQTTLEATHPYQSRPMQWFLNLKPVWFAVDYISDTNRANIYAFGNPALFLFGGISVVWSAVYLFLKRSQIKKHFPLLFLLIAYAMVWLPWLASPRIMFFYHYLPAVPLLMIILSYMIKKLWSITNKSKYVSVLGKTFAAGILMFASAAFIVWYPHWTFMSVPIDFMKTVYFALETWK